MLTIHFSHYSNVLEISKITEAREEEKRIGMKKEGKEKDEERGKEEGKRKNGKGKFVSNRAKKRKIAAVAIVHNHLLLLSGRH